MDINTILADMPASIKAYTASNADGSYTIVINAKLSSEQQRKSYYHECMHIQGGDYDKTADVDTIEIHTHAYMSNISCD